MLLLLLKYYWCLTMLLPLLDPLTRMLLLFDDATAAQMLPLLDDATAVAGALYSNAAVV